MISHIICLFRSVILPSIIASMFLHSFLSSLNSIPKVLLVSQWQRVCLSIRRCEKKSLGNEYPLENEIATQWSVLAWMIPWAEKSGDVESMGSQRGGHDLMTEQQWVSQSTYMPHLYPLIWLSSDGYSGFFHVWENCVLQRTLRYMCLFNECCEHLF